jgi:hypothetical protein
VRRSGSTLRWATSRSTAGTLGRMRYALLAALTFVACASDPCQDARCTVSQGDAGAVDLGRDAQPLGDRGAADIGADRPAPMDAGTDVGFDVANFEEDPTPDAGHRVDTGPAEDCASRREHCFCPDGTSSSHDVCVTEWCDCAGHMGPPDAGVDAAVPPACPSTCVAHSDCAFCRSDGPPPTYCCTSGRCMLSGGPCPEDAGPVADVAGDRAEAAAGDVPRD